MNSKLPEAFIRQTRQVMGEERFTRFMAAFSEEAPVSIRINPRKSPSPAPSPVPWCPTGTYLPTRPNFTFDPLLHAGCYYVQEAASMFLDEVLRQCLPLLTPHPSPLSVLDLCAAPGGKSTLMRSALPEDSVLYSNEPVRQRAGILLENVTKWGYERHFVTNLYPKDYRQSKMKFDLILCDVPCSGEGMFRKDPATIGEWSVQSVERCWQLQREIVSNAWECLRPGGLLIYSTCTFNTKENEENVRWMLQVLGARVVPVTTRAEWNITGSLLDGFDAPVYRFIPGITRSEGLFMSVLQKGGGTPSVFAEPPRRMHGAPPRHARSAPSLPIMEPPALHTDGPRIALTYQQAMAFLRRESLVLPPDTPLGLVEVCFHGHGLGTMKNLGTRANNLYPKEWRIKTTHVPSEYEAVVK